MYVFNGVITVYYIAHCNPNLSEPPDTYGIAEEKLEFPACF